MGTFTVPATLANPRSPERRLALDLLVDTGATYTMLPAEAVAQLEVDRPHERVAVLASGERVTYGIGEVLVRLNGEEWTTIFLAGPPGCHPLLGAVTLEQFGLAVDPVRKRLVPVPSLLV